MIEPRLLAPQAQRDGLVMPFWDTRLTASSNLVIQKHALARACQRGMCDAPAGHLSPRLRSRRMTLCGFMGLRLCTAAASLLSLDLRDLDGRCVFFFSFVVISGCTTFEREKGVKMSNHGPDTGKNGKKS